MRLQVSDLGPAAQASIPGVYAWAVTVAPAAMSRGAPWIAKVVAFVGVAALAGSTILERRYAGDVDAGRALRGWQADAWARGLSVWGLVLSSALVWALAPAALSPARLDAARGIAGMIGWALFAFASAAPSLKRSAEDAARVVGDGGLKPRSRLPRGDLFYLSVAIVAALGLQVVG